MQEACSGSVDSRDQSKAYAEIMAAYPTTDPWHSCLTDENCGYMTSFVERSPPLLVLNEHVLHTRLN